MAEFSAPEFLPWLIAIAVLFGLLWGSFLNVCIFRVVRDLSIITPRSFCPYCEKPIAWYDNVPVISYALLGGRCRHCKNRISLRYPLIELITGALFGVVMWRYGLSIDFIKWAVFESLMIVLFSTDLEVQILPDEFTIGGIVIGFVFAFFAPMHGVVMDVLLRHSSPGAKSMLSAVLGAVIVPVPLWAFAAFYKRVRGLEADPLGFGDVKLMCLLGVFLGFEHSVPVFVWGTVAGAVVGLIYIAMKGRLAWKAEIPYGTFLCGAGVIAALVVGRPA